jgi:hypothetical protein
MKAILSSLLAVAFVMVSTPSIAADAKHFAHLMRMNAPASPNSSKAVTTKLTQLAAGYEPWPGFPPRQKYGYKKAQHRFMRCGSKQWRLFLRWYVGKPPSYNLKTKRGKDGWLKFLRKRCGTYPK